MLKRSLYAGVFASRKRVSTCDVDTPMIKQGGLAADSAAAQTSNQTTPYMEGGKAHRCCAELPIPIFGSTPSHPESSPSVRSHPESSGVIRSHPDPTPSDLRGVFPKMASLGRPEGERSSVMPLSCDDLVTLWPADSETI